MTARRYDKVYYHHLMKCGGISVNNWLASIVPAGQFWDTGNANQIVRGLRAKGFNHKNVQLSVAVNSAMIMNCKAVSSHVNLIDYITPKAFKFTVLREPRERLASLISYWRERVNNLDAHQPENRAMIIDCAEMNVGEFIRKYQFAKVSLFSLDNHLTRAISTDSVVNEYMKSRRSIDLLPRALRSLEVNYDYVGLTSNVNKTLESVSRSIGAYFQAGPRERLNKSKTTSDVLAELAAHEDLVSPLVEVDEILYSRAVRLNTDYDAEIERVQPMAAMTGMDFSCPRGTFADGEMIFHVNDALMASGTHGRDGSGLDAACVWTGPGKQFALRIPTPRGVPLEMRIWLNGYAHPDQLAKLKVFLNDRPAQHRLEQREGYLCILGANCRTEGDFVDFRVDFHETYDTAQAGIGGDDARRRGFAFSRYGWRIA
jgi:hypothetical protein